MVPGKLKCEKKWWEKYRNVKHRPRHQLSVDSIFWKSLKGTAKEYVKRSSMSGITQIFDEGSRMTYRLVWIVLLALSCVTFVYLIRRIVTDQVANPLIVTTASSTYSIADIDFPAVAICNVNRVSKKAAEIVARDIKQSSPYFRNTSLADIIQFVHQTGRLLDFSYDDHFTDRFEYLLNSPNRATLDSDHIIKRMAQLAPNCSAMLLKCKWASKIVYCSDIFSVRRTARGHCCAFNYVLEYNSAGSKKPSTDILDREKKQKMPGYLHGLAVMLDLSLDDYAYPIRGLEGFEIFIFDPTDYPDPSTGRVVHRMTEANQILYFELRSTKQQATPEVRKYPAHIRKCLFKDEWPTVFGDRYSYSACLVQCRINTFLKLCRCIPYFLPSDAAAPNCTFEDLHCLFKFRNKFFYLYPRNDHKAGLEEELQDSLDCPECLPDCEFTKYDTKSFWTPIRVPHYREKGLNYSVLDDMDLQNKCLLAVYHPTEDGNLDILDVVAYWYEILSNVGGLAGVLFGFSLLCIFEIIYYILRFIVAFWENVKEFH